MQPVFSSPRARVHMLRSASGHALSYIDVDPTAQDETDANPIVLFDAGMGAGKRSWGPVADLLDEKAGGTIRIVSRDRAGYGDSEPAQDERRVEHQVGDALTVIDDLVARYPGSPLFLCGHSYGGLLSRLTSLELERLGRTPNGLVLCDPTDETVLRTTMDTMRSRCMKRARILRMAHKTGLVPIVMRQFLPWDLPHKKEATKDASTLGMAAELESFTPTLQYIIDAQIGMPDCPSVILGTPMSVHHYRGHYPSSVTIVETASDHFMPFRIPDVIAATVVEMVRPR